ncbi:ketoacyl-ACP synthase III family protein [Streptomyces sp. SL13]|jgi:3-oxoacyl-[acyl-carrier-protein] synthase-3|uniref:Ketoacyl-ACP synthase III family protein n=1 Tax=Streptantibioticus silvisoli TaxID=2705255 RepID=A0AA90H639_9ACTN|nr:ketoacyl-ACP synthase III family protein [Streptantibioticus silvisoli]MDI5963007.1 ketoacyl-ACP synthase III family protein [Streptantibioticus silvisoli]MDI5968722.1 ketoacyl-ACP synthase III family protein [Streptantibioticus silvisoli]
MKVDNVHINSLGVVLPEWASAEQAVADGLLDAEIIKLNGLTGAHIAGDVPALDMAVTAARTALERSKLDPEEIGAHIHSAVHYQGPEASYPPGYILRELGLPVMPAFYLQQGCNGMLGALEVAIGQITGAAEAEAVLLTTGENFSAPGVDRWKGFGQSYISGDGAAAVLVGAEEGFARVRSLNAGVLNVLEKWHRGNGPLLLRDTGVPTPGMPERATQFNETEMSLSETLDKVTRFGLDVMQRSLVDAGLNASDIAKVVSINMDGRMIEYSIMMPLGLPMSRSAWDFGKSVGHVGGADVFITLEHLVRTREVGPGDNVLLFSQGPGWISTAAVVTITDTPPWAV